MFFLLDIKKEFHLLQHYDTIFFDYILANTQEFDLLRLIIYLVITYIELMCFNDSDYAWITYAYP